MKKSLKEMPFIDSQLDIGLSFPDLILMHKLGRNVFNLFWSRYLLSTSFISSLAKLVPFFMIVHKFPLPLKLKDKSPEWAFAKVESFVVKATRLISFGEKVCLAVTI